MLSPDALQAYIRKAAALTHDVVEAPPFVLFFNPNDDLRFYNYGVPVGPVRSLPEGTMASLARPSWHATGCCVLSSSKRRRRIWRRRWRSLA